MPNYHTFRDWPKLTLKGSTIKKTFRGPKRPLGGGDTTLTHIILYGQSLALGAVPTGASVISSTDPDHKMFNVGVRPHYDTSGIPNVNAPIDPDSIASFVDLDEQIDPNDSVYGETFASGIATKLTTTGLLSCTGKAAYTAAALNRTGDNSLTDFNHFQNTYATALHAKELADVDGLTYSVGPIVFKQGEADGNAVTSKSAWKTEVTTLRDDLASHLKHATHTDTSGVQMIVDQQAWYVSGKGYGDIAVAAIELHRTGGNNIVCAGPTYPEEFTSNSDPHLSSNGYRNYGEKLGRIIETINGGGAWNPCYITSVSRSTTTITVNIHVPTPPLAVDTTLISSIANKGFAYSGASITDVSITDDGTGDNTGVITITINADAAGTLDYAYENGTNVWIGATLGSRGNIRDSESAVTDNDSRNLYNWLCNDQWTVA